MANSKPLWVCGLADPPGGPWISSSFRRWHSNDCSCLSSWGSDAVAFYGSVSRPIRRRNGWPARLPKPFLGTLFRAFSSVTMMVLMARRSLGGFEQWAFAIAPSRPDRHGGIGYARTFDRVDPP